MKLRLDSPTQAEYLARPCVEGNLEQVIHPLREIGDVMWKAAVSRAACPWGRVPTVRDVQR